jgi:hypothetical protein
MQRLLHEHEQTVATVRLNLLRTVRRKNGAFNNVQGKVISRHSLDENSVVLFYVERLERNAICRRATSMIRSIGATALPKCAR